MSHRISQNLKGALGEVFIRKEFDDFELIDPFHSITGYEKVPPIYSGFENWFEERYNKFLEKYGTFTLPDFLVKKTKIFIEVKTGKSAKLEKSQLEEFPKILKKGFRIFIIRPELLIEKRKFEVVDFYCSEFLGKNKRNRISLAELKQLIKAENS